MEIGITTEYASRLLIFILSTLILLSLFPTITYGSLSGSLENDLSLNPRTSSMITYESELDMTYRLEGIVFASNSFFHEDSYHSQQFGVDFELGSLDIDSSRSFDPANTRMNYLLAGAGASLGGVGIDNTLLLEHADEQTGYGAGYKFPPQTKSVELNPGIDLDWASFEVYTDMITPDDENLLTGGKGGVSTIGGLRIKGFSITEVDLGNLHLSSLTALHENLFRLSTENNIDLHANDYVLSPDPVYSGLYTKTDYDEETSLKGNFEAIPLSIGLDTYFNLTDDNLFSFGLLNGTGQYRISDQFNLRTGIEVKPGILEQVRLGFDYYF